MNVYLPNLRLPSAYQEVEYIESSGTQYINTGVTVNSANRVFKLKYQINTNNNNRSVFGTLVRGTEAGPNTRFSRLDNQLEWDCYAGNGYGRITYNKAIPSGAEEYELGNNYIKDLSTGTTLVTGTASNKSRSDYIPIFGRYQSDGSYVLSSLKLYYFQIIDNGTAIRDFVPCYRKSDSVIGLYDLVNNQFYTNSGTGTFSKGNDVTMSELKNAYIGERPLELKQIFDFSTATGYGDYTYYKVNTNGLTIDNANGCCRTNGASASGMVYKSINAKACWIRILFNCTGAVDGNIQIGPYSGQNGIPTGTTVGAILEHGSYGYNRLRIYYYGENSYANYTISNNTDYYLDLYYENGLYTVSLMDASMNVLQSLTKQDTSGHNTMPYSGFAMWNGNNSYQWRIKKYREDYKI